MHTILFILISLAILFYLAILLLSAITFIKNDKKTIYRDDGQPYLIRYRLMGCKWFKIRVHHILLSDYDCLHDHPWNFVSFILRGGYFEKYKNGNPTGYQSGFKMSKKWYGPFRALYRPATWQHSLEIPRGKTAWTFVIMFKRTREWGFWTRHGFVHHTKYNSKSNCE